MANDKTFESIKHVNENGGEFWLARELQIVLQYKEWRNFEKVIKTAQIACKISQHEVADHFVEVNKTVEMPSKAKPKKINDYKLTRYACYLIVMNGDPRKEIIANGQNYFAVKTRQQELNELHARLTEDEKRLFIRGDIRQKNMLLAEAAKRAGIITPHEYAIFQDFGYRGLYNGESARRIAERKGVDAEKESILDYMGSLELAANLFRITTTEDVLRNNNITDKKTANDTHYEVGQIVRNALKQAGATMPEKLPLPDKSIKELEKEKSRQIKK
jgi:DNA-damage-inducible protein D